MPDRRANQLNQLHYWVLHLSYGINTYLYITLTNIELYQHPAASLFQCIFPCLLITVWTFWVEYITFTIITIWYKTVKITLTFIVQFFSLDTIDRVRVILSFIERRLESCQDLFDFRKKFDSVDMGSLWAILAILERCGIPFGFLS